MPVDAIQDIAGEKLGDGRSDGPILCSACGHAVTHERFRAEIDGSHTHTFANPHGIVYRFGCFSSAPGTAGLGGRFTGFTWFDGHSWQVAVCGACLAHLGWCFRSSEREFYGLILDRLGRGDSQV